MNNWLKKILFLSALVLSVGTMMHCTPVSPSKENPGETSTGDGGNKEVTPDAPVAWKTPFDPTVCGAKTHKWLPPSEMGKVVMKEKSALFSLDKDSIKTLLKTTRYKDMGDIKYGVVVYKFRYVTQDHGKKVEATGVMAFPNIKEKTKAPYVLWLHGTSGFMDKCAPSRDESGPLSVALLASQGYIAVAPDYIGMNGMGDGSKLHHAYLVGEAVALGSLDSLRAADSLMKDVSKNVAPDGRLIVWGGSQGGHATLFSMLYAPYYAPKYKMVAGVAIVPPVDLLAQSEAALKTLGPATITLAAGAAAMSRWYGFGDALSEMVTNKEPYFLARELPKLMDSTCDVSSKKYKFDKTTDIFQEALYKAVVEGKSWKGYEKWQCMLKENSLNYTSVKRKHDAPILYVVSGKDELVNPVVQRKSYDTLCKQGYRMNYIECKDAKHTRGAIWSLPNQFAWVADRLAGKPIADTCKRPEPICCPGSDPKVCTP